jgi:hypothetical protein
MFKLASDFLSLDFLRRQNQKNKPESQLGASHLRASINTH